MSAQTMIDVAAPILEVPAVAEEYRGRVVPRALCAALIAFAEELEALATSTLAAGKRGAKGKSTIYTECAAMLRGRAAELETHGPISDAERKRADALARTEADAERLRATADDFTPGGPKAADHADQAIVSINESTALEVGQSEPLTCGTKDEFGYECEREPHPPGFGAHETYYPDGSVACRWPDVRMETPPMAPVQAGIAAYLRGERDALPEPLENPSSGVVDLGPAHPDLAATLSEVSVQPDPFATPDPDYTTESGITVTWDGDGVFTIALPATEDPFATVEPVSGAPWRLPADPRPFAFDPSTAIGVPDHVSYSQITTGEACGLQLRLKKRDGVIGQPALWNVGGTAFHACVERIERLRLGLIEQNLMSSVMIDALDGDLAACAELFSHELDAEISRCEVESGIDRERFRVSGKGTENEAWWRHNGALMVRDYVAHSDAMRAEGWEILNIAGKMVGLELDLNTPIGHDLELNRPVMLNARMDVVWFRWEPASSTDPTGTPVLHLRIEDGKSGAKPVTDTFQLGLYGHVLQRVVSTDFPPPVVAAMKISAAYYDARHGKSGDAFDPLAAHSWAEIEYRGLTTLAMHSAGVYPANPKTEFGGPCGLCDVRHACPIMAMRE